MLVNNPTLKDIQNEIKLKIDNVPNDGNRYVRKYDGWYEESGGGGSSIGLGDTITYDDENAAAVITSGVSTVDELYNIDADPFSQAISYSTGDYIIYDGKFYVFTTTHEVGVWDDSQVSNVSIGNELEKIKQDYLPLTGGNITGSINIESNIGNTPFITFRRNEPSGGAQTSFIRALESTSNTKNVFMIQGGGNTIIGSGEAATNLYIDNINSVHDNSEKLYLASDESAYIHTNVQTTTDIKTWSFNATGVSYFPDNMWIRKYNLDISSSNINTSPSNDGAFGLRDKNNRLVGCYKAQQESNGNTYVQMFCRRYDSGDISNFLKLTLTTTNVADVTFSNPEIWRRRLFPTNLASSAGFMIAITDSWADGGFVKLPIPISMGGTGTTTLTQAHTNLGIFTNYTSKNSSTDAPDVSVPSDSVKNLTTITLTQGAWLITATVRFAANANGYRYIGIADSGTSIQNGWYYGTSQRAVDGEATVMHITVLEHQSSGSRTVYLNAKQDSGTNLTAIPRIKAVKIYPL